MMVHVVIGVSYVCCQYIEVGVVFVGFLGCHWLFDACCMVFRSHLDVDIVSGVVFMGSELCG